MARVVLRGKCAAQHEPQNQQKAQGWGCFNKTVASPMAPGTSGLGLLITSVMDMVCCAGVLDINFQPIVDIHTWQVNGFEALTSN
jgi:EAL domain-containing protein (putative c-di-GMP-specific phosphodiesterase class I)